MDRVESLKLRINNVIDDWMNENVVEVPDATDQPEEAPAKVLPVGYRAVRASSSGDRVYYIDEENNTRQWVTNPEVLKSYGFDLEDVVEIEESELLKYQMAPALYKPHESA